MGLEQGEGVGVGGGGARAARSQATLSQRVGLPGVTRGAMPSLVAKVSRCWGAMGRRVVFDAFITFLRPRLKVEKPSYSFCMWLRFRPHHLLTVARTPL